jgi:hypothetical protein
MHMTDIQPSTTGAKFPLLSLQNSLNVAEAVRDAGGANTEVPKSVIASHLGSSENSGAFLQRLGSARAFGLIEGRGAYRLTDDAKRYFFPADEDERRRAQLAFLASPPVFNEIIKRFDGNKLPAPGMLANILHREYGVSNSWKDRVASSFVKAAQIVGAVDGQNFLRYGASLHSMESTLSQADLADARLPAVVVAGSRAVAAPEGNSWLFQEEGQFVRLESSAKLSPALWQKLNAYVQVLRPSSKAQK